MFDPTKITKIFEGRALHPAIDVPEPGFYLVKIATEQGSIGYNRVSVYLTGQDYDSGGYTNYHHLTVLYMSGKFVALRSGNVETEVLEIGKIG